MALLTTWTETNRYDSTALQTVYKLEIVSSKTGVDGFFWFKITRTRTKSFQFVGLSADAVTSCATAMYERYIRSIPSWTCYTDQGGRQFWYSQGGVRTPCASVETSHREGHMWEVNVQLSEEVCAYTKMASTWSPNNSALEYELENRQIVNSDNDGGAIVNHVAVDISGWEYD